MSPTQQIIEKATQKVKSGFTTEVLPCTKINKSSFVITIVNVIRGEEHIIDFTFNTKTASLIWTKNISSRFL